MSAPDIIFLAIALVLILPFAGFIFAILRAAFSGKLRALKESLSADIYATLDGVANRVGYASWMQYKDDNSVLLTVIVFSKNKAPNKTYQVKLGEEIIGETKQAKHGQQLDVESAKGAVVPKPNNNDVIILLLDGQEYARGAFTSR